jgi:hypothetical protein
MTCFSSATTQPLPEIAIPFLPDLLNPFFVIGLKVFVVRHCELQQLAEILPRERRDLLAGAPAQPIVDGPQEGIPLEGHERMLPGEG